MRPNIKRRREKITGEERRAGNQIIGVKLMNKGDNAGDREKKRRTRELQGFCRQTNKREAHPEDLIRTELSNQRLRTVNSRTRTKREAER